MTASAAGTSVTRAIEVRKAFSIDTARWVNVFALGLDLSPGALGVGQVKPGTEGFGGFLGALSGGGGGGAGPGPSLGPAGTGAGTPPAGSTDSMGATTSSASSPATTDVIPPSPGFVHLSPFDVARLIERHDPTPTR
jgi:hypothetical protein